MSKIVRVKKQINELKECIEYLEREIEVSQLIEYMNSIVNINLDNIDDPYSLMPLNERSVFTFGLPRGVGKTKFIIDQANSNENTSVIWVNNSQFLGNITSDEDLPLDRCIMLYGSFVSLPRGLSGKPITRILIDEYQKLSGENLIRIYDECVQFNRGADVEIKIIRVGTPHL